MSVEEHKREARAYLNCAVITVSDTRTKETDKSGRVMISYVKEAGHQLLLYEIIKDEEKAILATIQRAVENNKIDAILLNGGTGIATRDITIETVRSLFEKEISGFGELFRMISYEEDIGSAAMLSRATAGVYKGKVIFVTPGSTGAVKLAMEKLIIPELGHIIRELEKDRK